MKEGDIVVAPFPQADGRVKKRPGVVLREIAPIGDLLICSVSTQLNRGQAGFDDLLLRSDADFAGSGLKQESVVRLGYLLTLPRRAFAGTIGEISRERHVRLLARRAK